MTKKEFDERTNEIGSQLYRLTEARVALFHNATVAFFIGHWREMLKSVYDLSNTQISVLINRMKRHFSLRRLDKLSSPPRCPMDLKFVFETDIWALPSRSLDPHHLPIDGVLACKVVDRTLTVTIDLFQFPQSSIAWIAFLIRQCSRCDFDEIPIVEFSVEPVTIPSTKDRNMVFVPKVTACGDIYSVERAINSTTELQLRLATEKAVGAIKEAIKTRLKF